MRKFVNIRQHGSRQKTKNSTTTSYQKLGSIARDFEAIKSAGIGVDSGKIIKKPKCRTRLEFLVPWKPGGSSRLFPAGKCIPGPER